MFLILQNLSKKFKKTKLLTKSSEFKVFISNTFSMFLRKEIKLAFWPIFYFLSFFLGFRVKTNSPNLKPIFSRVIKIFLNSFPECTKTEKPIK